MMGAQVLPKVYNHDNCPLLIQDFKKDQGQYVCALVPQTEDGNALSPRNCG